jgi:two-component system, cell cycle sensor histidine kinase and response regulator CckA
MSLRRSARDAAIVHVRDVPSAPVSTVTELVGALPGIVWEADGTDYVMSYVSPQAADLLGHDPAAWLSVPSFWEDHVHPDDRTRAMAEAQEAVASLSAATLEYRFAAADGSYSWFRDYLRVVEHADGHRHIVGFMADVSDESAVDAERALLATAVERAAESIVVTEADGTIIYVNPAFEAVTGYDRAEVIGRSSRVLDSGHHSRAFYAAVRATLADGRPWAGELVSRRANGELFVEEASITPVEDPRLGVRRHVAVKRDVTAEREDRAARDWLAASVQSALDAVYTVSLDGRYLAWNDAAARLYGWNAADVIGRSIFDVVPESEHDSIRSWITRVSAGESIGPVDTTHRGEGGRILALSAIASPVRDRSGAITGVATIARDISGELELAAQRQTLETQLRQAQKMEALGRLAGGIAHDFNNLLTAIRGYADIVADGLEGTQREDVEQVRVAAARASELTKRLLAFARSSPAAREVVDLDARLRDAMKLTGRLVPERIDLDLRLAAGCRVLLDPIELEQLLMNLVVNAVDAIVGVGRIDVETRLEQDGRHCLLVVRDTGSGMDEATRSRIFEPFFTTKDLGAGTGLGLATVYAIVGRAEGEIAVSSTAGAGTSFTVRLPVDASAAPAMVPEPQPATPHGAMGRILIVEDADVLRALASRILGQAGYEVMTATCPAEVLGRDLSAVDALVCDVVMPGMSGPEMVRRLDRDMPVLFVSGYAADQLPDLAQHPSWGFIPKPYTRETLLTEVERTLRAVRTPTAP